MKRVLVIVTSPFDTYGIGAVVRNYTDVLMGKFHFDFLLCAGADECGKKYIVDKGINVVDLRCSRLKNPLCYMYRLAAYLKKNKYDVVHAHGNSGTLFFEIHAAKIAGVEVRIAHCHNTSCKYKLLHYLLRHWLNREITVSLSCSKMANQWLFETEGIVLNNAISTSKFKFNKEIRDKTRQDYNLQDSFTILNVGRLSIQKNQDFIIRLMPKVVNYLPNAKFVVVGDGERYEEYKKLIELYHLENNVLLLGKQNNVDSFYQAADCFVFPSVFEGLGLAVIEAQASGLSCIASTEVPEDANAARRIVYLSFDEDKWVDEIIACSKVSIDREIASNIAVQQIIKSGYDINYNSYQLEHVYNEN